MQTVIQNAQDIFRKNAQDIKGDVSVLEEMMHRISSRGEKYGNDVFVKGTGLDDECERELENERELEKEVEQEIPRQIAVCENDWDFTAIFRTARPDGLPKTAGVIALDSFVCSSRLSPEFKHIFWDQNIYMTENFWNTVRPSIDGTKSFDLAQFLRPVYAVLQFEKSGSLLLLSERESNRILTLMWTKLHDGGETTVILIHLSYMKSVKDQHDLALRIPTRKHPRSIIRDAMIARCI